MDAADADGGWSTEEDAQLKSIVDKHLGWLTVTGEPVNWGRVSAELRGLHIDRSAPACKRHWHSTFAAPKTARGK